MSGQKGIISVNQQFSVWLAGQDYQRSQRPSPSCADQLFNNSDNVQKRTVKDVCDGKYRLYGCKDLEICKIRRDRKMERATKPKTPNKLSEGREEFVRSRTSRILSGSKNWGCRLWGVWMYRSEATELGNAELKVCGWYRWDHRY